MDETVQAQPYDPNRLLDELIDRLQLKNDAALARSLDVAPPLISKIRHRRLPVGASLLIRMNEVSGLSIQELRGIMGDRRTKVRISDVDGKPRLPLAAGAAVPPASAPASPEQPQAQEDAAEGKSPD